MDDQRVIDEYLKLKQIPYALSLKIIYVISGKHLQDEDDPSLVRGNGTIFLKNWKNVQHFQDGLAIQFINLGKVEFPLDALLLVTVLVHIAVVVSRPLAEPEEVVVRGAVESQHVLLGAGDAAEAHHLGIFDASLRECRGGR